MSTAIYTGASGWGKSYHVLNHVLPKFQKSVVFDPRNCFTGDRILIAPTIQDVHKAFMDFHKKDRFRIVVRLTRLQNPEHVFNSAVGLASGLGRIRPTGQPPENTIQFVCDEVADAGLSSSHHQSPGLKSLIRAGRHDNVDSHLITQFPVTIHNEIRNLATKLVTFRLMGAADIPLFYKKMPKAVAKKIETLQKFCRLEWRDTEEIEIYGPDDKIIEKIS